MKRKFLLVLLTCICVNAVLAQTRTISGRVTTDSTGQGLSGVSITVKGSQTATSTNNDGRYSIIIPERNNVVLVFTYVGHRPQEVTVGNRTAIDITMREEASSLNDVVVIGYQTVRKRDVTGSVSSVTARQIKDVPLSSAAEALQGRLAGVQIISSEGGPGADVLIRVRGGGSITQDNSPLYIVDGVQVESALNVIAPQDIATIDVLKDASTTAIYGARAANGVVIITTKAGRAGKTQVNYNGAMGVRKLPKTLEVLDPYEFVKWQWERSRANATDSASFANTYGTNWDTLNVYKAIPFINWQDEVFGRSALFQNHNVSVSGGTQNTTLNLSVTANLEEGIQLESGMERYLVNLKLEHRVNDKMKVGMTARYLDQVIKGAGTTDAGSRTLSRLRHAVNYRPFELPKDGFGFDDFDEAYFQSSAGAMNPVLTASSIYRRQYSNGFYLTGFLNYNLAKNLVFRSTVGFDNLNIRTDLFYNKLTSQARNFASLPIASIGQQQNKTISNSNTLQYSLSNWKTHHDISFLIGQEIVEVRSRQNATETRYFPADILPEQALANMGLGSVPSGSTAQQPLPTSYVAPASRIASFFGRISYSYEGKYLANFNLRADRSSKFSSENGTLVFPSGSVAWRFSREKFMANVSWIDDAKLRYGFGTVGNNRIGNLLYQQLYGVTGMYALNHSVLPAFAPSALANPSLRWEKNKTSNFGLDLTFFRSRLDISIDVYKNSANDLLLAAPIPSSTGYSSQIQNAGSTSNRGVEIQINATPVSKARFQWTSNFNIAFNKNRVESLGGVLQQQKNSGWQGSDGVSDYLVEVGKPVGQMYGFVTDGFFKVDEFNYDASTQTYTLKAGIPFNAVYGTPQPGMLKWKDLNGDGVITADGDRTIIGDANPKFTGGWNNQFTYGNFDASVFVNFVVGNDIYNANKVELTDAAFPNLNMLGIMKDRWTNIDANGNVVRDPKQLAALNENAKIWTPVRVQRWWLHSWAIEDGSYLRFNNVTLGYRLPQSLLSKIKITSFRVYATVNNLATITNYSGYDPDVTTRRSDPLTPGVDFAAYPRARTFVAGVNVTF